MDKKILLDLLKSQIDNNNIIIKNKEPNFNLVRICNFLKYYDMNPKQIYLTHNCKSDYEMIKDNGFNISFLVSNCKYDGCYAKNNVVFFPETLTIGFCSNIEDTHYHFCKYSDNDIELLNLYLPIFIYRTRLTLGDNSDCFLHNLENTNDLFLNIEE